MSQGRKSWADQQGIKSGVWGEVVDGINIKEANRATVWAITKEDIQTLWQIMHNSYRRKGVKAVVFGVHHGPSVIKYAVFVKDGFLQNVGEED